jgi:hypothetical protein
MTATDSLTDATAFVAADAGVARWQYDQARSLLLPRSHTLSRARTHVAQCVRATAGVRQRSVAALTGSSTPPTASTPLTGVP